jgi:hypothetical protein
MANIAANAFVIIKPTKGFPHLEQELLLFFAATKSGK